MPIGPGKYDDLATLVREQAAAQAVAVLVFRGAAGSGFSVQGNLEMILQMPVMLRYMAEEIERGAA
jgi:enoyl-CoA hydratase/carnithine racemase